MNPLPSWRKAWRDTLPAIHSLSRKRIECHPAAPIVCIYNQPTVIILQIETLVVLQILYIILEIFHENNFIVFYLELTFRSSDCEFHILAPKYKNQKVKKTFMLCTLWFCTSLRCSPLFPPLDSSSIVPVIASWTIYFPFFRAPSLFLHIPDLSFTFLYIHQVFNYCYSN